MSKLCGFHFILIFLLGLVEVGGKKRKKKEKGQFDNLSPFVFAE